MSRTTDKLIAASLGLEVRLLACQARLLAGTDDEALHDLRITVRRLRSLLRPLRRIGAVAELDQAAAALGRLSSPLRDIEVLLVELQRHGCVVLMQRYQSRWREGVAQLLAAPPLDALAQALEQFPEQLREQQCAGQLKAPGRRIRRRLQKQQDRLCEALADPAHDRHRVRLLIKRLRYAIEAYPWLAPVDKRVTAQLKSAQGALGDWHDRWQWLLRLADEPDLAILEASWRDELAQAEQRADQALQALAQALHA